MKYPINIPPASIGQPFGAKWIDYSQFGIIGHNGIDFPAPKNTPIFAISDGYIIEQTSKETGFGLRITQRFEILGKYYLAVYGHMDHLEKPIDISYNWNLKTYPVKAGETIGYVDSTGYSTGHHLHLGVYENDKKGNRLNINNGYQGAIDPMLLFKGVKMIEIVFVHKAGTKEYGFLEKSPYNETYQKSVNEEHLKFMAKIYGQNILNADGTVQYGLAHDINL